MSRPTPLLLCGAALLLAPLVTGQETDEDEDIFELSPFTVEGSEDEGYRATSTLAGTRIRTDLKDVGSAISVYTEEFMKDIGATGGSTLLQYTTNAEVAGVHSTYAGVDTSGGLDDSGLLRNPVSATRIRGLAGADNTRDFFATDIPWDSYSVNRIDVQRGANAMLFGLGSPAGIINATLQDASFQNEGKVEIRFGSHGSFRTSASLNKVLVEDQLAIRFAALKNDEKYKQKPAYNNDERFYLALRWEPKIGPDSIKTAFRAKYESGSIDANRPRTTPPLDSLTAWFRPLGYDDESNPYGGLGQYVPANIYDLSSTLLGGDATENGTPARTDLAWVGNIAGQQTAFLTFDGATGTLYDAKMGVVNKGAIGPTGQVQGTSAGITGSSYSEQLFGLTNLGSAAKNGNYTFSNYGLYRTQSLLDSSVFDFYNNLLDGPNKSEWGGWDAYNLNLSQTWFNNRAGIDLTFDKQNYNRGGESFIPWAPTINLDITPAFQDGTPNPNFGRPFVASTGGNGSNYDSERKNVRASLFAEVRGSDFLQNDSFLAKLFGKHIFNAVSTDETYTYQNTGWDRKAADQAWQGYWNNNDGSSVSFNDRAPNAVVYLGDSVAGASSASGAYIPPITSVIDWGSTPIQTFESIWNPPAGVAYNDPWVGPAANDPTYGTPPEDEGWTQRMNRANYVGWSYNNTLGVISNERGSNPILATSNSKTQREIKSIATTWQGHFWEDAVITTLGWRKDEVTSRDAKAGKLPGGRNILAPLPDYSDDIVNVDQTVSGGAVVHLNNLFGNDPLPLDVSLSYNRSSNFQVGQVRRDVYGNGITNPNGSTEDYGITLGTKDGKYSFRAIKYESNSKNATASLGSVGNIGSTISNGLTWRNIFLYKMPAYSYDNREVTPEGGAGRAWLSSAYPYDPEDPGASAGQPYAVEYGSPEELALEDEMINAWNDIQQYMTDNGFLQAWNINPVPLEYLTDRSTYAASLNGTTPAAQYIPPAGSVTNYSNSQPSNFAVTADVLSKGYEFELTGNPIDNLRLSFNASRSEVINNNVGGDTLPEFVDYVESKLAGTIAGDMPRWGNPGGAMYSSIWSAFGASYKLMKLQEGTAVPENRKWRYTVVGNYTFSDGNFKGLGLGGSYRWQDKVAIGYPLIPIQGSEYTFDLANPIYGPSEGYADMWVSYKRKLTDKIDWRVQLNVRNVGAGNKLIPITVQPDPNHSLAGGRIAPSQEWYLSNTFSF